MNLLQGAISVDLNHENITVIVEIKKCVIFLINWLFYFELFQYLQILNACSNESNQGDSIAQMGKRLAFEIIQFCKGRFLFFIQILINLIFTHRYLFLESMPSLLEYNSIDKISFISHSMGGLIVRSALQVNNFITFYHLI